MFRRYEREAYGQKNRLFLRKGSNGFSCQAAGQAELDEPFQGTQKARQGNCDIQVERSDGRSP